MKWHLMFIGPCVIVIVEEWKTDLMSLAILFHFLCAQHVSDINVSIFRSLRLCWWVTTSVVLFLVVCVLALWCGWFWVVFILQAEAQVVLHEHHLKPGTPKHQHSFICWEFHITFDACVDCKSIYIFCISERPKGCNFFIYLSFLVSFGEVKEAVTQKWCKALQH